MTKDFWNLVYLHNSITNIYFTDCFQICINRLIPPSVPSANESELQTLSHFGRLNHKGNSRQTNHQQTQTRSRNNNNQQSNRQFTPNGGPSGGPRGLHGGGEDVIFILITDIISYC